MNLQCPGFLKFPAVSQTMEDVSRLALFAQEKYWDISHSQCMEQGDNHCMEEAWFLVGQACDAVKFDPDLVGIEFPRFSQCLLIGFFM